MDIKDIEKSYFKWLLNKFNSDEPIYDRNGSWNFKLILPENNYVI